MDMSVLRLFNTGTEEFIEGLVGGLAGLGVDIRALGLERPLQPTAERLGQASREKRSPLAKWRWEASEVSRAARRAGASLLHIPYMTHPARSAGIPTVVNVHDVIPYRFPDYQRRLRDRRYFAALKVRLPLATRLVAVSDATADDMDIVFPRLTAKVAVIPNGVHESFYREPTEEGREELAGMMELLERPRILYVGGYQRHKNLDVLLHAASRVLDSLTDAELVLVGGRHAPELEALVSALPAGRVRSTGRLSRPALRALYASSTVLAFPSRYEGFGLPPAQAMAAGVPVIASPGPALQEVLGDAALWADPGDVDEWVEALSTLLRDGALRRRLSDMGLERAARFRWTAVAARYRDLYREVLAS